MTIRHPDVLLKSDAATRRDVFGVKVKLGVVPAAGSPPPCHTVWLPIHASPASKSTAMRTLSPSAIVVMAVLVQFSIGQVVLFFI